MDTVVLLHGLWRSRWSMIWPQLQLRAAGFRTAGISYPSRRLPLPDLARYVAGRLPDPRGGRLHFVTHSLGGLIVREMVRSARPPALGRVVMMGPPNQGSELARQLRPSRFMRRLAGPVGPVLASEARELADRFGPVDFELGVIAGVVPRSLLGSRLVAPGDGRVLLSETRIDGMADFVIVRRCHALLMNDRDAIGETIHFLREGRFRDAAARDPARPLATATRERT